MVSHGTGHLPPPYTTPGAGGRKRENTHVDTLRSRHDAKTLTEDNCEETETKGCNDRSKTGNSGCRSTLDCLLLRTDDEVPVASFSGPSEIRCCLCHPPARQQTTRDQLLNNTPSGSYNRQKGNFTLASGVRLWRRCSSARRKFLPKEPNSLN